MWLSKVRSNKLISLLALVLILSFSGAAYESCRTTGVLQQDGSMELNFEWSIQAESGYYYPADGDWSLYVSGQAEDIEVRNDEGELIEYEVRPTESASRELWMSNGERIGDSETYTFNISYTLPRAASIYSDKIILNKDFFNFCRDENTLDLQLPDFQLQNPPSNYNPRDNRLLIEDFSQDNVNLRMTSDNTISPTVNYREGIFNITSPRIYREHITGQIQEAETILPLLGNYTGLPTPQSLQLEYADPESDILIEDAAGQYSEGKITIPVSRLTTSRQQSFETLVHELVHAYNDREESSVSDWWWEEGTAEYITREILRGNDYTLSNFYPSESRVNATFEKCTFQRSFINNWNPVDSSYSIPGFCPVDAENVITDKGTLGYAYSRVIVEDLDDREEGVVSQVQSRMYRLNVTFTERKVYRNNQINFFASQAADTDFTQLLKDRGLETSSWEDQWRAVENANSTLQTYQDSTRFEIFGPQKQTMTAVYRTFYSGRFEQAEQESYSLEEKLRQLNRSYSQVITPYNQQEARMERLGNETRTEFFSEAQRLLNESKEHMREQKFDQALQKVRNAENKINSTYERTQNYQDMNDTLSREIKSAGVIKSFFTEESVSSLERSRRAYSNGELEKALDQIRSADRSFENAGKKTSFVFAAIIIFLTVLAAVMVRRFY